METITIAPSAYPPSPVLSPPIDFGKAKKVPIKPQKKQSKTVDKNTAKADGVVKPKQSKSRNGMSWHCPGFPFRNGGFLQLWSC